MVGWMDGWRGGWRAEGGWIRCSQVWERRRRIYCKDIFPLSWKLKVSLGSDVLWSEYIHDSLQKQHWDGSSLFSSMHLSHVCHLYPLSFNSFAHLYTKEDRRACGVHRVYEHMRLLTLTKLEGTTLVKHIYNPRPCFLLTVPVYTWSCAAIKQIQSPNLISQRREHCTLSCANHSQQRRHWALFVKLKHL